MDAEDLVALVVARAGSDRPSEVARWLGMNEIGADQKVRRWIRGRNGPAFEGLVLMLEKLGVLDWSRLDGAAPEAIAPDSSGGVRLEDIDRKLDRLLSLEQDVRAVRAAVEELAR